MSESDAERCFGQVISRVADGGTIIVERSGQPVAAVVPIEWYERWREIRNAQFAIIDRIRASIPDYPEEEVDADIAEALAAARANRHPA